MGPQPCLSTGVDEKSLQVWEIVLIFIGTT